MNRELLNRLFYILMSALVTCFIAGVPVWMAPVAAAITAVLNGVASLLAEITWQPYRDADAMMKNVCPRCRTFNSLEEVTSADPEMRTVECHACESLFGVKITPKGRFTATYLGERRDSE